MTPTFRAGAAALVVLAGLAVSHAAQADEAAPAQPFESTRALVRLQEQVAHGSGPARSAQGAALAAIGVHFAEADPAVWRDPRNARAAILYLLSGGKPAIVRTVLSRSTMPRDMDRLLKGALAYAEGQDQVARDLLDPIEPRSVPAVVGGPLALVKATLFAASDPAKAAHLLDLARLLVPGSLVEEAALRRQIGLDGDAANLGKVVALSRQYLHRFPRSIYAQNFKQHFADLALRISGGGDIATMTRLDPAIAVLSLPEQRAVFLGMAKAAVVKGHAPAAQYAAGRAAALSKEGTPEAMRAQLYLDAAAIASADVERGTAALAAADAAQFAPDDAALRDAALAVARSVQAPVADREAEAGATQGLDPDSAALVSQAQQKLAGTEHLGAVP